MDRRRDEPLGRLVEPQRAVEIVEARGSAGVGLVAQRGRHAIGRAAATDARGLSRAGSDARQPDVLGTLRRAAPAAARQQTEPAAPTRSDEGQERSPLPHPRNQHTQKPRCWITPTAWSPSSKQSARSARQFIGAGAGSLCPAESSWLPSRVVGVLHPHDEVFAHRQHLDRHRPRGRTGTSPAATWPSSLSLQPLRRQPRLGRHADIGAAKHRLVAVRRTPPFLFGLEYGSTELTGYFVPQQALLFRRRARAPPIPPPAPETPAAIKSLETPILASLPFQAEPGLTLLWPHAKVI